MAGAMTDRKAPEPISWVQAIAPYVPGRATTADGRKVIKLSANENPLGTSERRAPPSPPPPPSWNAIPIRARPRCAKPSARCMGWTRHASSTAPDRTKSCTSRRGVRRAGDEIIHVRYGFAVYEIATRRVGAEPVVVADHDYATDVDAILAAVTDKTKVVFVANPNNPTGTYAGADEIARLHAGLPPHVLLVVDQAYAEYLAGRG